MRFFVDISHKYNPTLNKSKRNSRQKFKNIFEFVKQRIIEEKRIFWGLGQRKCFKVEIKYRTIQIYLNNPNITSTDRWGPLMPSSTRVSYTLDDIFCPSVSKPRPFFFATPLFSSSTKNNVLSLIKAAQIYSINGIWDWPHIFGVYFVIFSKEAYVRYQQPLPPLFRLWWHCLPPFCDTIFRESK